MIKIMWFLKKADHLTLDQFAAWWLESHVHLITDAQKPWLKKYVVNVRRESDALAGKPAAESPWDGVAEQWFEDDAAVDAVYGKPTAAVTRADTMAHVSRIERIVVREHEIPVK
jgi:hypothetical protein